MDATADLALTWHLVGHLQSNKAKKAGARFDLIHSIDEPGLIRKLEESALAAGRRVQLLVQADLAGEATKHGARPEQLIPLFSAAAACTAVHITGLMLLPPFLDDPEQARPYFRSLRTLREQLVSSGVDPAQLTDLSMGMSHDFEVAVEEGATMVRVGTAIFGNRAV
jgi:pyridoxal phosphate enzyme (YggS family)